jgi:flagellin-like protein
MRLRKLRVNGRAVSPVIATLLMIAIAVAAAILVYVWSMGLVGTLQGTGGQQTREQLIMEAYDATDLTTWLLYLRNVGPTNINVAAVYVEGTPAHFDLDPPGTITPGGSANLKLEVPFTPTSGAAYTVKIVTTSGAVFSYSVIAGRAS